LCHVINLVVQAILAALGEADNPDEVDYYTLNKEQPLHLDIDADPDQIELDNEEFEEAEDEMTPEESITLEEEEKSKATGSPLSKVCNLTVDFSYLHNNVRVYVSCASSQTKLSHHPNDGRGFDNVQSQYTPRKNQSMIENERL
jgi:hypothetical protein